MCTSYEYNLVLNILCQILLASFVIYEFFKFAAIHNWLRSASNLLQFALFTALTITNVFFHTTHDRPQLPSALNLKSPSVFWRLGPTPSATKPMTSSLSEPVGRRILCQKRYHPNIVCNLRMQLLIVANNVSTLKIVCAVWTKCPTPRWKVQVIRQKCLALWLIFPESRTSQLSRTVII